MRPRYYSAFWLGYGVGLLRLSAAWRDRDDPPADVYPGEQLSMRQWLRLPEVQRAALVQAYIPTRTPIIRYESTAERRKQEAA